MADETAADQARLTRSQPTTRPSPTCTPAERRLGAMQRRAEQPAPHLENGDVPYEGDLSEDEVDSALNELWQLQRTGSAQGVSRAAARRERRSQASAKVQNVLHEMLAADTVAAAQHVAKDMLDAAGNELVANGLLPLLEALAAASTAETSRTAGLDVQMIATAADDVLADVQAASARLAAGGGRSALGACVPTKRIATRNSPAPSQKRQRRREQSMEECAAERREEERSSTMLDVVVIVLNEATRKLERAGLMAFVCAELTLLQRSQDAAQRRLRSFSAPSIRKGMRRLQEVHVNVVGPIVDGQSLTLDGDAFLKQCSRAAPVVARLWRSMVTPEDGRGDGGWRRKVLRSIFAQASLFRIARVRDPIANNPTSLLFHGVLEQAGASRGIGRVIAAAGLAPDWARLDGAHTRGQRDDDAARAYGRASVHRLPRADGASAGTE
ncbi:hypothetical protein EMIHUDRAFT_217429 [Emiliania huxleyi CCMP1516]|uniref:Uncharacterized protein n=2 Tax=Emiliania huxleyi TaxID=2903 RepID=A0A0D3IAN2_EMIH1|nr:hypothetical protein EMIHUDRAFT_217429 [Emiliania huxleyi CCMP1516]EOD08317.1 hypothetical protein EMIHUDRAFT_217429 [Emiliania huxleyi CCMP1516]|eukprot:XP_005760746.1 hypothetical protein EMIHUDRAFT_217429 [Emiliania huxleyi CCMP1516]